MKTSLKKLLHHHKNNNKDRKIQPLAQLDELAKASEAMQDMRDCYDSLLSAAAAATNSAYEFSESLREMGVCLLQKIALNDDEESGKAMLMLGKVQFELQKLVDSYRNHIFQTITVPSESLINELHTVEEMKYQCDEKRELYEYMRTKYREKGRSKSGKGETFSLQQLQEAKDEFDEEATLFVFRLKSLKQGQSRSLLTQAARHHAAQLSFFRKALKSLEAVEPHVKSVTQEQHIDYQFISLEDDESEDVEDDDYSDEDDSSGTSSAEDEEESRFDCRRNDRQLSFASAARYTLQGNVKNSHEDSFVKDRKILSQSAPLFPQRKFEPAERIRQLRPSSSRKINSYVLPKPGDVSRISAGSQISVSQTQTRSNLNMHSENLYHSYPLQPNTYEKLVGTETLSGPIILNSKSVLKESNNNKMPPPLTESISMQLLKPQTTSSSKKLKLQSFSGPLASKPLLTKTLFSTGNPVNASGVPPFSSGPILRSSVHRSSSPSKISPTASPTFTSPRISELHELPRPPVHVIYGSGKPSGGVGFSAPLASRSPEITTTSKSSMAKKSSPLPAPPLVGYFSMPLSVAGTATKFPLSRASETSPGSEKSEDNFSPPATPMMFATRLSNIN
ncbi:hypothetical protein BVRB_6g150000 [Beta vulgaris subsp. vulgaris]|uniref:uncharacterized protein At2g33490 n=1 Tax=Beta vulgaris subsp. vulgaris TaxID=3555 RepID=UPI00053F9800|nr:uncharacterized protein At2g33490 [Beta vulgaris subsp. vulgaris]KMT07374.1 hypothetical protein BVRB_6g150000 [Beta vulgaris subsp. vulgaris]